MNINWKLRLQNKTTLLALLGGLVTLAYAALRLAGLAPGITESVLMELLVAAVDLLVLVGVVADPTTPGLADSARALGYDTPGGRAEETATDK